MNNLNFNLEQIDQLSAGDVDFKKELIEIFLAQIPEFISNMTIYLNDNKFEELAKEAHTAKSSALIFGMKKAGDLLKRIQSFSEKKKKDQLENMIELVHDEFKIAANFLQNNRSP